MPWNPGWVDQGGGVRTNAQRADVWSQGWISPWNHISSISSKPELDRSFRTSRVPGLLGFLRLRSCSVERTVRHRSGVPALLLPSERIPDLRHLDLRPAEPGLLERHQEEREHRPTFLFLLGSFFVPLFGVLLADWLLSSASYANVDFFRTPPLRAGLVAAWLAGFAFYQWLHPLGPSWWVELVERTGTPETQIGSSLPSFALSFGLAALAIVLERRIRRPASATA